MSGTARATLKRWATSLVPATLAGILIGGVLGALSAQSDPTGSATALIRVYQPVDPDQIVTANAPSADSQQSYISGEIAYLGSQSFANAVAKQLNETSPPAVSAVQDGQSSVISLSAEGADGASAQRIVAAAVDVYGEHAQQQNRERGQKAIDAISQVIGQLRANVATPGPPNGAPPAPAVAAAGADARVQQLDLQRTAIDVQTRRGAPIQVVQSPTVTPDAGVSRWSLAAVAGGLIGGLLALTGVLIWRRRTGVITTPAALEASVDRVLRPDVILHGLTESSAEHVQLARKLYAQLPNPRTGRILVVGASPISGSDVVAGLLAAACGEHGSTSVLRLPSTDSAEATPVGATVVIDGGSVDTMPALPDAASNADQIVVVARLGRDMLDGVRVAAQLAVSDDVPVSAVCVRDGFGRGPRTSVGKRAERETIPSETSIAAGR